MIEIKATEGGYGCKITGIPSLFETMNEGAACTGAIIGAIARAYGAAEARSFVRTLKEILEDKEAVNAAILAGIGAGRTALS